MAEGGSWSFGISPLVSLTCQRTQVCSGAWPPFPDAGWGLHPARAASARKVLSYEGRALHQPAHRGATGYSVVDSEEDERGAEAGIYEGRVSSARVSTLPMQMPAFLVMRWGGSLLGFI